MADITNPIAIKFVNEDVRPLAEKLRALKAEIADMSTRWYAGINNLFPNDTSPVADGRDDEGISRLTGADIHSFASVALAAVGELNSEIVAKPCVRPLSAS